MAKANVLKRIVAYIIDSLIGSVAMLAIFAVSFAVFIAGMFLMNAATAITTVVYIIGLLLGILVFVAYMVLKDGLFGGRSPGKKLMKIRVVNTKTNGPCSLVDSLKRNITMLIPIISWIELVMPFIDAEGLRLGDKFAGTQVVE